MEKIKLSERLSVVADFVPKGARLADIGSDHAFLPSYLVQTGQIDFALAGEVVEGPYSIAQAHVNEQNLHKQIFVRLANGLEAIEAEDEIDTIVIAGMGGILISEILSAGQEKLSTIKKLILQPNNHEDSLRQWLNQKDFVIVDEKILFEAGKFYEIIVAEHSNAQSQQLSKKELRFGPVLAKEKSSIFRKKWEKELHTLTEILTYLPKEQLERAREIQEKIKAIKEILE